MRLSLENVSLRNGFFLAFVSGFVVRLVPEVLSFPHPIGFDTVYYAARMKDGVVWFHWSSFFSAWLVYSVFVPLYSLMLVDPFLLLKVFGPLLYGGSTAGIFFFAWRGLNWGARKSLLAAVFFAFQLAALRISWDLYRNLLGLMFLLFALPFFKKIEGWKDFAFLAVLSLLVVFGHELASVAMFAVVLWLVVDGFLGKKGKMLYRVLVAVLPAFLVFLGSVYFRVSPAFVQAEANVVRVNDSFDPHPGGLFFLVDYLRVDNPVQSYGNYFVLVSHVVSLFVLLYLVWLPLVLVGFFRDRVLDGWTVLLLVGSFSCLVIPFGALNFWNRWMFMLVYPLTFYAVNGLWKVLGSLDRGVASGLRWMSWVKVSRKGAVRISLVTVLLGSLFMSWPLIFGKVGLFCFPTTCTYVPSTMQSSSLPLQDTEGTVEAVEWLNGHMADGSSVLVHHVFFSWVKLGLDESHVVVVFTKDLEAALNFALESGFSFIYFVWWNRDIGWYGLTVPSGFVSVFESGRISVFQLL